MDRNTLKKINGLLKDLDITTKVMASNEHFVKAEGYDRDDEGHIFGSCNCYLEWDDVKPLIEKEIEKIKQELGKLGFEENV